LSTCRQISNLSICRSVDFSRQINKSTDRQIDRSTDQQIDQQSTNLIWDTKTTKKKNFVPTKFVNKFAKQFDRPTDKIGFLGHSTEE
jgi:hypothetical protein